MGSDDTTSVPVLVAETRVRTLWIIRHAEREDHVNPGWLEIADRKFDPPLSAAGQMQAHRAGLHLKQSGLQIDHLLSSPFLRALQTAQGVAKHYEDLPIFVENGLHEWVPAWQDPPALLDAHEYSTVGISNAKPLHHQHKPRRFPETTEDVCARVQLMLRYVLTNLSGNVVLVSHGYIVPFIVHALGIGPLVLNKVTPPYCCISKFVWRKDDNGGFWTMELFHNADHMNDVGHANITAIRQASSAT